MARPVPIHDIEKQFSRSVKLTCIVLVVSGLGLLVNPTDTLVWGFIVGGLTSILNAYFLRNRLLGLPQLGRDQAKLSLRQNFTMRLGLVVAVIFFAAKADFLSIYGVGAGLLLVPCLTVIDAAFTLYRHFAARDAVDKV